MIYESDKDKFMLAITDLQKKIGDALADPERTWRSKQQYLDLARALIDVEDKLFKV